MPLRFLGLFGGGVVDGAGRALGAVGSGGLVRVGDRRFSRSSTIEVSATSTTLSNCWPVSSLRGGFTVVDHLGPTPAPHEIEHAGEPGGLAVVHQVGRHVHRERSGAHGVVAGRHGEQRQLLEQLEVARAEREERLDGIDPVSERRLLGGELSGNEQHFAANRARLEPEHSGRAQRFDLAQQIDRAIRGDGTAQNARGGHGVRPIEGARPRKVKTMLPRPRLARRRV